MQGRQFYASSTFSSRAHTIVAITFAQKGKNEAGQMMTKTSIVNLVDLAGRYVQRHRINCLPFFKTFHQFSGSYTGFPFVDPSSDSVKSQSCSPSINRSCWYQVFFFQDSGLKVTAGQRTMCGAPDGHLSGQLSACLSF